MFHLTARVAWHDSRWDGTVCSAPSCNSFCPTLDRIRLERDEAAEAARAGRPWRDLSPEELPACKAESGAFMSPSEWTRRFEHPYARIPKAASTHGHLKPTRVKVPAYSTFAVPFAWMLRSEQAALDERLAEPLPPDEAPPFNSAWVFGRARQQALLNLFRSRLQPEKSLVFFYCKEGQPLGDTFSRLVVAVGRVVSVDLPKEYEHPKGTPTHLMWDLLFRHSIRPDGEDGFLLPYHDYLEPTGNSDEDERREGLLREIAVTAEGAQVRAFSYAAELAPPDVALSILVRCLDTVRKIRAHGIAKGPWDRREEWLNQQIALAWKDRGPYPGLGSVLEALGMRLGTALAMELRTSGMVDPDGDPWPAVDALFRGRMKPPNPAYAADLLAMRDSWTSLAGQRGGERLSLLKLLARFALSPAQALRWFDADKRHKATALPVSDPELLSNPYRICETDLGDWDDEPVSIGTVDRGVLPDSTVANRHPVPAPSSVGSPMDPRRVRAAIVSVLRQAADQGDSLLAAPDALQKVAKLDLQHPCTVGSDWLEAHRTHLSGVVELVDVRQDESSTSGLTALQLTELKGREERLRTLLSRRAAKALPAVPADWKALLKKAIHEAGGTFSPSNERHVAALREQAAALGSITTRRLTALVGRAGTGKTSILGALTLCEPIARDGILFLAPTGKARVRLGKATGADAMTVAQFLCRLKRYDGDRQRPLFAGEEKHRKEKTVVIDECSMLTMDDLVAVLEALDLAHVQRLILVGDPNQLPPIGVGRPFADFVAFLEQTNRVTDDGKPVRDALARLTVEVRASAGTGEPSDALRLASWYTREPQPVDADRVVSDLELGRAFNDLDIVFWANPEELRQRMCEAFVRHLGLASAEDIAGFDASLGFDLQGHLPFKKPEGAESWQILSPVRMHPHGVHDLNRWLQQRFRPDQVRNAANPWVTCLGDERIVVKDKVIQTANQWRDGYDTDSRQQQEHYLANGEVGLVTPGSNGWLNVLFAGRPGIRFGYRTRDFPGGSGPLELAYALTVHKAQGSEFRKVFVVIPKNCRLLSRELVYTALTRSRDHLVLLIEGKDASILFDLTRPERSETARRNTNLFEPAVRAGSDGVPFAEHLIHRTEKGHLVRSKSELVIANMLFGMGIDYEYERPCDGTIEPGRLRPDFSFATADGDLILWEHLGMLDREDYRRGWEWKRQWYARNGFVEGRTLFTSSEDRLTGLDSGSLKSIAARIKELVA